VSVLIVIKVLLFVLLLSYKESMNKRRTNCI